MLPYETLIAHRNVCMLHRLLHNMRADNFVADYNFSIVQLSGRSIRGALSFKPRAIKTKIPQTNFALLLVPSNSGMICHMT